MRGTHSNGAWARPSGARRAARPLRGLLALVLALVVLLGLGGWGLARDLLRLRDDLTACAASVRQEGGALAVEDVRALRRDVEGLDRRLRALRGGVGWLPALCARQTWWPALAAGGVVGSDGLEAAGELTSVAWWTLLEAESALESGVWAPAYTAPDLPDPLDAALDALARHREPLLRARERLARAAAAWPAAPLRGEEVPAVLEAAPLLVDALLLAPNLLPDLMERPYLLAIQNSDELRPTGGFISGGALLRVEDGRLAPLEYWDSYGVEAYHTAHPPAPPPLARYMGAGSLLFRDANWSPDYPASAEVLAALYRADAGQEVGGVIAVEFGLARTLLDALGPLPIPGYGVTVTAENVLDTAVGFWDAPLDAPPTTAQGVAWGEWLAHRKDFGGALLKAGLARLETLSPAEGLRLAAALARAARDKQLLVWALDDPQAQADLRRAGLDGSVARQPADKPPTDFLMVVDANLGWNKVDRRIERRVDYRVDLGPDGAVATLRLTYANRSDFARSPAGGECVHASRYGDAYEDLTHGCYWNYLRVLAPRGSTLRGAWGVEGDVEGGLEAGRAAFGALVVVPPGDERTLVFEYNLPAALWASFVEGGAYHLLAQPQPGSGEPSLRVTFAHHGGARLLLEPPWRGLSASEAVLDLSWTRDRALHLAWR